MFIIDATSVHWSVLVTYMLGVSKSLGLDSQPELSFRTFSQILQADAGGNALKLVTAVFSYLFIL